MYIKILLYLCSRFNLVEGKRGVPLGLTPNSARFFYAVQGIGILLFGIFELITTQKNKGIFRKLSVQGNEIEIFSDAEDSYFDKYLNECKVDQHDVSWKVSGVTGNIRGGVFTPKTSGKASTKSLETAIHLFVM